MLDKFRIQSFGDSVVYSYIELNIAILVTGTNSKYFDINVY